MTLLNSFKAAQSVTIKLFADRANATSYTFMVSPEDLVSLKDFCKTVTSSQ